MSNIGSLSHLALPVIVPLIDSSLRRIEHVSKPCQCLLVPISIPPKLYLKQDLLLRCHFEPSLLVVCLLGYHVQPFRGKDLVYGLVQVCNFRQAQLGPD